MIRTLIAAGLVYLGLSSSPILAQTVQLPTFRHFSVSTTVVVPDSGRGFIGGVNRASYGSSAYGVPGLMHLPGAGRLFGDRGFGADVSSSSAHASATIMDLGEMDRAVLAEAAARRGGVAGHGVAASRAAGGAPDPAVQRKAAFLSKHIARTGSSRQATAAPARVPRRQ